MRYKIAFPFPLFDQKNIQHAHSHFAFAGWVSQMLYVLMLSTVPIKTDSRSRNYNLLLGANLICAYGMLLTFGALGYHALSISFSSFSIFISFLFAFYFFKDIRNHVSTTVRNSFKVALIFNIVSSIGTLYLVSLIVSKNIPQHEYLASVYWYLHFQYNGWFFFTCLGLFFNYIIQQGIQFRHQSRIFILFLIACVPAYGLSILWLHLPLWIEIIIGFSAFIQVYAWMMLIKEFSLHRDILWKKQAFVVKLLMLFVGSALTVKLLLQAGSTIPDISKLAFGFRPIVIAYLHLVLLAVISGFLILYSFINKLLILNNMAKIGLLLFMTSVFLNELILATQGIASFTYTVVPGINESLFWVSIIIAVSIVLINTSQLVKTDDLH